MDQAGVVRLLKKAQQAVQRGETDSVEQLVLPLLRQHPREPNLRFLAGLCSMLRGRDEDAVEHFQQVLNVAPTYVPALANLGLVYRRQHKLPDARRVLLRALDREPRNEAVWTTLSGSYVNEGDPVAGEQVARQGLERCPNAPDVEWNLALLLLEQGQWQEGWQRYQHRFESSVLNLPEAWTGPDCPPRLRHPADIAAGEVVVCFGEQGLGDEILFASMLGEFLQDVVGRGGRLMLQENTRLQNTFRRSFPELTALSAEDTPSRPDWICPIGDLGRFYRNSPDDFPQGGGYLKVASDRVTAIRRDLHNRFGQRPLVGLAWSGGLPRTHQRYRQIPLPTWLSILQQPCQFVSLQYRDDTAEVNGLWREHGLQVARLPELTLAEDYDETFNLIAALDLVITVPTSVLHAAGSVGTPCWVIMDSRAAWRESSGDRRIIWYPKTHTRYVRQPHDSDWAALLGQVATDLATWVTDVTRGVRSE